MNEEEEIIASTWNRRFATPTTLRFKSWFKRQQRMNRKSIFESLEQQDFVLSNGDTFLDSNGLNYTVKEDN